MQKYTKPFAPFPSPREDICIIIEKPPPEKEEREEGRRKEGKASARRRLSVAAAPSGNKKNGGGGRGKGIFPYSSPVNYSKTSFSFARKGTGKKANACQGAHCTKKLVDFTTAIYGGEKQNILDISL